MRPLFTLTTWWLVATTFSFGQIKPNYEYSTTMPYGTLDIRTRISSSDYYYLQENKTFSFRESSPGVRTETYHDMTSWDSSPYRQGNLRRKTGTLDKFVMNYRLLLPAGYSDTYGQGYPMIVHFHGAVERANCYYENCYHATPDYTVEANSPPAPTSSTHRLLNNDHNLNVGGKQYLDARNLAGTRQPDDPSMPARAFPGFVLFAQMFNIWDSLQVEDVIRIVRLVSEQYNIDEDRIYVQGISIGGYSVYEAMKRASWLFAAGLPMSGVWDANIFTQNLQDKVAHIPLWVFQGGTDTRPSPEFTENIIDQYEAAGGSVRYTLYSTLGHVVWFSAYGTSDYYTWILSKSKANLHVSSGNTVIDRSRSIYPKLVLAEGFLAYQWEKDGVMLSHSTNSLTVTSPGKYRARFSRKSASPTEAQWNNWSQYVTITDNGSATPTVSTQITSPQDGQSFTAPASITITATASVTEGSISKVEFYNGQTKLGEDPSSPYSFTWSNVPAGNYSLTVKALDNAGNSATDRVGIIVNTATPPTVTTTITSPDDGQSFTAPASITITATASVTEGSISKVEFYNGQTKLGEDPTAPYSFTWSNVPAGNYSLTAKALDNAGNSATDRVGVIVNPAPAPTVTTTITSPGDGQSFTAPASITITATASVTDGSISKVEFFNGQTKLGEDLASPYSFTWTNVPAGNYSIVVKALDNSGNSGTDAVDVVVNPESPGETCASTGTIRAEVWTGISGTSISSIPVDSPPSSVSTLTIFETAANIGDNYGSRVRGYVCVPATGSYTFWIASDDVSELWLSTDETAANKRKIAYVTGWTSRRQWDKYASQGSGAVSLVAGRRYYIEALLKEATGGDHLEVGWQLPNGVLERPIPGHRLIPMETSANTPPTVSITSPDDGQSFFAPASITFSATASDSDGSVSKVEFYNGNTKLGEDVSAPYSFTWTDVPAGVYSITAKAIDNSNASATDGVQITVTSGSGGEECASTGKIQAEVWTGISGIDVSSIPVNNAPSSVSDLTLFETPANMGDNYGLRARGYVCVPASGSYTFWIASDDRSELWLSTDDNPANKARIAYVSGWTYARQWDKYASQKSVAMNLVAGRKYYIEALLKEGTGGDHMEVGWQLPDGTFERPIPGNRLISFQNSSANNPPTVNITTPEEGQSFIAPASVNITATASDSDGSISKLEFYNGSTKLGEDATSPFSFTWTDVPAGVYSLTVKAIDNSAASATDAVQITVTSGSGGEACTSTGSMQAEVWTGISGIDVSDIPVNSPPSSVLDLTVFETRRNMGDNYGIRARGFLCAPASGSYTFWIASDDRSELWLSTDDNPANKVRIANVSGWTYSRQWDKYTSQRSSSINLQAGRRYYIEALLKEGTGGDHVAVGWQLPDGTLERPIPGSRLSPFQSGTQTTAARMISRAEEEWLYSQIQIYPNPVESRDAQLILTGYERILRPVETHIEIINMTGEAVFNKTISCGGNCSDQLVNIHEQLAPGVYLVTLTTNGARQSKRLFVK